jgi:pyridoxamine 5'-phosphate oxidase
MAQLSPNLLATVRRPTRIGPLATDPACRERVAPERSTSLAELLARFARKFRVGEVPRPPPWIGFRVRPDAIEFWTHREHRLHDREIYFRHGRGWQRYLLQP